MATPNRNSPYRKILAALRAVTGIAYPFLVYFGRARVPAEVFILLGVALILFNIPVVSAGKQLWVWIAGAALMAAAFAGLSLLSPILAVKAYPIGNSLLMAAIFGMSLVYPPSLIERMARLRKPDLSPGGVVYTRKVTIMWVAFLLANAAISAATALWGSLAQWTLWNGLISYLAIGALFAGELVVRRFVRRRERFAS